MIEIEKAWRQAFAPPDRRPIGEWSRDNITLPSVLTRTGKFDPSVSPHYNGPLAALQSDSVREVNILAPVRSGKTLIADIGVPWSIACDHASVLWVFQIDTIAKEHAELRQWPIIENCPPLAQLLPADRHKKRAQEIIFTNGLPLMLRGPSVSNLQSRGFKWVVLDEPWLYGPGIIAQAKARLGDFVRLDNSKLLAISQGGEEDSDWNTQFQSGVLHEFSVPCAGCSRRFFPRWTARKVDRTRWGIVFDAPQKPDGTYDTAQAIATLRHVCPHCGHEHPDTEKTRHAWIHGGYWVRSSAGAESPQVTSFPRYVSFHWNALIDYPWAELVKEWLEAQRAKRATNFAPLIAFIQKRLAEMRSESTVGERDNQFATFETFETKPEEKIWPAEAIRFMTVDRQSEDTYWIQIRGWAKGSGESRRIFIGRAHGEPELEEIRKRYAVPSNCVVIDSGYRAKGDHGVYAACIRYGWIAAKGDEKSGFFHSRKLPDGTTQRVSKPWAPITYHDPGEGTSEQGKRRCPLVIFSAPTAASRVAIMVERGLWVEPAVSDDSLDEMEREYRIQMSAEFQKPRINKFTGRRELVWVCPSGNNHQFDCAKMQVLAAMQANLIPAGIEIEGKSSEADTRAAKD
jgi:Phage terminase large subunit (GpA)